MGANSVIEMLDKWFSAAALSNKNEVEIEVSECFKNLSEDIVTRTAFGRSYEDGKAIFRLQSQQMILTSEAFQKISIPGYRFLPTKTNIKSWKLDKEIKKSLMKVIEKRKENWRNEILEQEQEENENGPKDLLGLMIQASSQNSGMITVNDIAEECKSFFFAGGQTTSNLLTWTTVLLAMHPEWQVLARDEVFKVCGPRDQLPSKHHLPKLKTVFLTLLSLPFFSFLFISSLFRTKIPLCPFLSLSLPSSSCPLPVLFSN